MCKRKGQMKRQAMQELSNDQKKDNIDYDDEYTRMSTMCMATTD